jgi:rfaE bifunctional protein kinase chain/domain
MPPPAPPSRERLLALVAGLAGREVLMLVDLVADRFVHTAPKRISREAPVLILRYEGEETVPGGGANAVANVAALGGVPLAVGFVGADAAGEELVAALAARGVDVEGIARRPAFRTPTKVRILAGGRHAIKQQVVRYDVEDAVVAGEAEAAHLERLLARWRGRAEVAVLSDYGYGAVWPAQVAAARAALGGAATVLCDSRFRLAEFAGLTGATPNEEEAEALLGGPLGAAAGGLAGAGGALLARLGARFLLVTRGSSGMSLVTADGCAHVPVHGTDEVADVTGAGDTVIGTFALALAAGATALEAALLANYAGGVVVMKRGTATLSREELAAAVEDDPFPLEELRWESC